MGYAGTMIRVCQIAVYRFLTRAAAGAGVAACSLCLAGASLADGPSLEDFAELNAHANAAISQYGGKTHHGSMGAALESLESAPLNEVTRPFVKAIEAYRRSRGLPRDDAYTRGLIKEIARQGVVMMDPGYHGGLMFQPIVDRQPPPPAGKAALRALFGDAGLEPASVAYLADPRCGQERVAGITLGEVATVCGAWRGVDYDSRPRQRLVSTHEAAHVTIYQRYRQLRGYPGLIDAAQGIFGDLKVHSTSHINEFFGLASEVLTHDASVWEITLVDLCQTELHLPFYLPDYVPSAESAHSLGYAVFYRALRQLEDENGIDPDDGVRAIVDLAYDGPDARNFDRVERRIRRYVKNYINEEWKERIRKAYLDPARAIVAWLEANPPHPKLVEGDKLYRDGDGPGAIKAWSEVTGPNAAEAQDSIADTWFWGSRGVAADGEASFKWRLKAIRGGDVWAALATQHVRDDQILAALDAIEDAIRVHGDKDNLLLARAQMFERLGALDKAEVDLQEVRTRNPGEPSPLNSLGYFMADRDIRIEEAIDLLEESNTLTYGRSPYILDSLGWAYYRAGRLDDALEYLQSALTRLPYDQAIVAHTGEVLWKLGQRDEARAMWARAERTPPTETFEYRLLQETIRRLESGSD